MIDVKTALGVVDSKKKRIFITKQPADKFAAAQRYALTEKLFKEWYDGTNATNTRELPEDLADKYEEACMSICEILMMEKEIIIKSE